MSDADGFVTALGCTVRVLPPPGHLDPTGQGLVLSLAMEQPHDQRFVEVYFSPDDRRSLAAKINSLPGLTDAERDVARWRSVVLPILRQLAERDAPMDGETEVCLLCDAGIPWQAVTNPLDSGIVSDRYHYNQRQHRPACPWRQARELLGIALNRVTQYDRDRMQVPDDVTEWTFEEVPA